jgi:ABC-2 type transport system permease protein
MKRLIGVELRRFFARRMTRIIAVAMLLGVAATGVGLAINSNRDVAGAHRLADQRRQQMVQESASARAACLANVPPSEADQACGPLSEKGIPPIAFYVDPRFSFHDHLGDVLHSAALIGALVALLLSASFIGAEWQAGTLASLLMWEPRRQRVNAAKVGSAVAGSVALAVVGAALLVGVAALVAATRGTFASVASDHRTVAHFAGASWGTAARGVVIVALAGALGAGLAMLLRRTVAALGVVIGYLVVGEAVIGSLQHGEVRNHLLGAHLAALLNGRYRWFAPTATSDGGISFGTNHTHVLHALTAGLELTAVAAAILALAALAFQRRDVT